jgi:hypothetical protein
MLTFETHSLLVSLPSRYRHNVLSIVVWSIGWKVKTRREHETEAIYAFRNRVNTLGYGKVTSQGRNRYNMHSWTMERLDTTTALCRRVYYTTIRKKKKKKEKGRGNMNADKHE